MNVPLCTSGRTDTSRGEQAGEPWVSRLEVTHESDQGPFILAWFRMFLPRGDKSCPEISQGEGEAGGELHGIPYTFLCRIV